jgi:hypothetical protein
VPLSKKILFETIEPGSTIRIDCKKGNINFEIVGKDQAIGADGIVRLM